MQIKDLKPRMNKIDVVVEITDIGDIREFSKFGKPGKVATATAKDATGSIKLTLWNEQIDEVSVGDSVHIKDGYVSEWQGEMQLTTGRLGSIEVVGKQKMLEGKEEKKEKGKKPAAKKEYKKEKEEEPEEWITPEEKQEDFDEEESDEEDLDVDEEEVK